MLKYKLWVCHHESVQHNALTCNYDCQAPQEFTKSSWKVHFPSNDICIVQCEDKHVKCRWADNRTCVVLNNSCVGSGRVHRPWTGSAKARYSSFLQRNPLPSASLCNGCSLELNLLNPSSEYPPTHFWTLIKLWKSPSIGDSPLEYNNVSRILSKTGKSDYVTQDHAHPFSQTPCLDLLGKILLCASSHVSACQCACLT